MVIELPKEAEEQKRAKARAENPHPGYLSLRDGPEPTRGRPLTGAAPVNPNAPTTGPPLLTDWVTEEQLAGELSKSVRTLWRWRLAGIGPAFSLIGSTIVYSREDIMRWLAAGGTKPRARGRGRARAA
jgi:hypothetical protein